MKVCSRCIYDESTPGISFDEEGVCNYCRSYDQLDKEYPTGADGEKKLQALAKEIKARGKDKKFDCVIGVSGGCDSSYLLYLAKEKLGLRPLAVHFDNGWNTAVSEENLKKVLGKLNIESRVLGMYHGEFDSMARAFLKASVPEIDAISDVALMTTLYMFAEEYGVKYIFDGHSFRTEGITPLGWFYFDGKYVSSVYSRFGTQVVESYPNLWLSTWMKWLFARIKRFRPLYYVDYRKEDVKKFLNSEFGWQWYGGHHMENRYTLFCDNYLLPRKFGIDLRNVEFSALIRSGQMTKQQALEQIKEPPLFEDELLVEVKNRLGFTDDEFEEMLNLPKRTYKDFKTYKKTFKRLRPIFWMMYKADLVPKSFYMKYTK